MDYTKLTLNIVGELKYHSSVSDKQESLPVVVSVLGKSGTDTPVFRTTNLILTIYFTLGSDMALIDAVMKTLQKKRRPLRVLVGKKMFL